MGGELTLLAVMRVLGHQGVPFYVLCKQTDFAVHSRWYRRFPGSLVPDPRPADLPHLLSASPLDRTVLMPCDDEWLMAAAALPVWLRMRFPSSMPEKQVVETMVNKWMFAQATEQANSPHPATVLLTSPKQLMALPAAAIEGRILKPLRSVEFATKHHVKGFLIQHHAQVPALAEKLEFPILLQEYIPGPPTCTYFLDGFVDRNGRLTALFARQRLRMFPLDLGNSSVSISVPLSDADAAARSLRVLLESVSYRGIFSAEFKRDPRDGVFKILELNARPWWLVDFAAHCGVDVCRLAYLDALELPAKPIDGYRTGRR
jgi:predicted ATP-grasp superfamily ATP-dependent carboligase